MVRTYTAWTPDPGLQSQVLPGSVVGSGVGQGGPLLFGREDGLSLRLEMERLVEELD